jgi:hypothetical protein
MLVDCALPALSQNDQRSTISHQLTTISYKNAVHLNKTIIFAALKKHL